MIRKALPSILFAALVLAGCGEPPDSGQAVAPTASVRVEAAGNHALDAGLSVYGTVVFSPEDLHAMVTSAEVRVERVLVSAGEPVRRDQVLMVVAPTPATRLERVKARADLDFSRQEHARIAALRKQELATNAEVAAAALAEANARAVLDGIEARIGNSSGELKAAEDGLVAVVDAQQGDIVAAGGALMHLADRADLRVRLGIEPKDLAGLREGQAVALTAIYDDGVQVRGHITKRISRIDPGSRLAEALVAIDGGSALLPGAMVKADISLDVPADAIAVPRSAVLRDGQRAYVFIVRDNKAVRAWVDTGHEGDKLVEIRSGVAAGDAVVVEGNYELTDGMAVKVEATKQ